jgi:hypothetical protein
VRAQDRSGWFVDGSAGHVWRSNVRLDRVAYYTDGQLVLSDEVAMPRVAEYALAAGYLDATWCLPVAVVAQRTLGGGDIRRQDMPFVSNRMTPRGSSRAPCTPCPRSPRSASRRGSCTSSPAATSDRARRSPEG